MQTELKDVICLLDKDNDAKTRIDLVSMKYNNARKDHPIIAKLFPDYLALWADKTEKRDFQDGVTYLPCNKIQNVFLEQGTVCKDIHIFTEGQILVRNPFNPKLYFDASNAEYEVMQTKNMLLGEIFWNLGATSITASCTIVYSKVRKITSKSKMIINNIDLQTDVKNDLESKYKKETKFETTYYPGEYNLDKYNKAIELSEKWFPSDEKLKSIIRQRNPNDLTPMKSFNYSYEMNSEINNTLDIAFNVLTTIGNGGENYKTELEKKYEVRTILKLVF